MSTRYLCDVDDVRKQERRGKMQKRCRLDIDQQCDVVDVRKQEFKKEFAVD